MKQQHSWSEITSDLKVANRLVDKGAYSWVVAAVLGSVLMAGLDTLGVAAMLPLLQLMTGAPPNDGIPGFVANFFGVSGVQELVIILACVIAAAFVLKSVVSLCYRWWLLGRTLRLTTSATANLLRLYVLAPYESHKRRSMPEIYRNVGASVPQAFNQVAAGLVGLLGDVLTLLAIAAFLLFVSPLVTVVTVVLFASVTFLVQAFLRRKQIQAGRQIVETDLEVWQALIPGLDGFRESRLASKSALYVDRFFSSKLNQAKAQRLSSILAEAPKYILEILFVLSIALMASILFATTSTEEAIATLGVFAAAAMRMLPTFNRITATLASVRAGSVGLSTLAVAVDELTGEGQFAVERLSQEGYRGDVEVKSIWYMYPDSDNHVLKGASMLFREGQTTAIVGTSGAGKSTLLDILMGLIVPSSGSVMCGGREIRQDIVSWHHGLGVVPQDVYLLDASLAENIAYGEVAHDIDHERLGEVLGLAQLDEFVGDLPEGLSTRLGQRGVRLSGGQRQRVGLARALYRRPRVLILDEATSALDNETEHEITRTVEALRGEMTMVVVAHRLSTVRNADHLIFMAEGVVEAQGSFDEVRSQSASFNRLVQLGELS